MFHPKHPDNKRPDYIIIRGNESDIFTVLLANIQKHWESYLWFDTGLDSDESC